MSTNKRIRMNISFSEKERELFDYIMSKKNSSKFLKELAKKHMEEELNGKHEQCNDKDTNNSIELNDIMEYLKSMNVELKSLQNGTFVRQKEEQKVEQQGYSYDYSNDEFLEDLEL